MTDDWSLEESILLLYKNWQYLQKHSIKFDEMIFEANKALIDELQ